MIFARIRWLYAIIIILLGMTLMIFTFYLLPQPYAVKLGSWFIRTFALLRIDVKGERDPNAQMLLINHQSDLDIVIMETITRANLAWVAKKELFEIPFFGLIVRLPRDIALERESKSALITLMREAKDRIDHGRIVTIFPEGTRTESGQMRPFKMGAKMVADKYALTVQPIIFIASAWHFSNKRKDFRPGGRLQVIYLDSFVADKHDPHWLQNLQNTMQKRYDEAISASPIYQ